MGRVGTKALSLLLACLAGPLWAGSVTRRGDDQVSIKADRVPLGQLLRELAGVTPIPNLMIEPKLEQQSVSSYVEDASVAEAVRKTLEESGIQFLLWGGGAEPLGLYVGDLKKANLPTAAKSTSTADLSSMSREERRAAREQARLERAEAAAAEAQAVAEATSDEVPADSFAALGMGSGDGTAASAIQAAASAGVAQDSGAGMAPALGQATGGGAPGVGPGAANGAAPGRAIPGLPPPVRGVASWTEADGKTTHSTGYTIQGDSVVYDDPNFVSFKNSPEARARRMNMDVSTLP